MIGIITKDLNKAYVEVIDNKITVTDYYFGVRKEKNFLLQDIASSEIVFGESINNICSFIRESDSYIVFRDKNGKYMFKILCAPETKQFFANHIDTSIKFYQ